MPRAMPASPLPLQKLRGLLFSHKLLQHSLEHGFPFGQAHSQRFHSKFLPFELHHFLHSFRHRHRPRAPPGSGTSSARPPVRAVPNEPIINLLQAETIRLKLCVFFALLHGPFQPLIEQLLEQVSMTLVRQCSRYALQGLLDQLLFCHGRIVLVLIQNSHVPARTAALLRWRRGPSTGAAMLLPIPLRYPEREPPIPTDRGSRRCIGTFRGVEAGTRAGGGFASGVVGQSPGRGYGSCRTLVGSSRERTAERREALPE